MKLARNILIMCVLVALTVVLGDVHRLLKSTDSLVQDTQKRVDYTSQDLNAILLHTDIVMGRLERASRAQEQVSQKSLLLLSETSQVLLRTNAVLAQLQTSTSHIDAQTVETLQTLRPVMLQAQKTLADTDKQVSDPLIHQMMVDIEHSAHNASVTTDNLVATSADIQKKVHQLTRPASLAKRVVTWSLSVASAAVHAFMIF